MKIHSSISTRLFFISTLALLTLTASAQFNKPLNSPRDRVQSTDARWNVGLIGGPNLTTWIHFHNPKASTWSLKDYTPIIFSSQGNSLGYFGGIAVENMLRANLSVGLNVIYAQHKMQLGYTDDHFPYEWDASTNSITYSQREKTVKANYQTIEVYVPITFYTTLASSKNIKPYGYVAPRFSYVLSGDMTYQSTNSINNKVISNNTCPILFNSSSYRTFNAGATVGLGSQFRININNYYFLTKLDISANLNAIPTFTKDEIINDDFKYLRFSADAHATLTLMLPIKKQLVGACVKWGKYD